MALLTTALAIAEFVPTITRWFGGDKEASIAESAISAVKKITGVDDERQAIDAIRQNPELQIKLQTEMNKVFVAELEADTKQLEAINETMRAEINSDDPYVRRWRPTMGYTVCATWFVQMAALSIVIVAKPTAAPAIISAMAGLSAMWGVALSILGISVVKRSQDKQVASGQQPIPGVFGAIASRIMGKPKE